MQKPQEITLKIAPVAKPRMTRSDVWRDPPRPEVAKYRGFKTEIALKKNGFYLPDAFSVVFYIPMPKSWSKRKRGMFYGQPHKQTPDLDNMIKALCDAFKVDDSEVYHIDAKKFWWNEGQITIKEI